MLLGDESVLQLDQRKNLQLLKMALIAAKKCIAIKWKSEESPSHIVWHVPVEKIMFNLKKSLQCLKRFGANLWHKLDVTLTEIADVTV